MEKLTARQQTILDFIRETLETQSMPPTRAEIAKAFSFASPNAAETHLRALAQKGAITLEAGAARGIRLVDGVGLPLVGVVAAGAPILAQEHIEMRRQIDPNMFSPRADYLLRVRGASMIDVGIYDGDLLAVHRTAEARDGQIIVARLDDDVTVKRLKRRANGLIELIAENADYKPILINPQRMAFAIEGLAVGLVRDDLA